MKKRKKYRATNKSRRHWDIFHNRMKILVLEFIKMRNIICVHCDVEIAHGICSNRTNLWNHTENRLNLVKWRLRVEIFVSFCLMFLFFSFFLFISQFLSFNSVEFFLYIFVSSRLVSICIAFYWQPSAKWISTMKLVSNYLLTNWLHQSFRASVRCKLYDVFAFCRMNNFNFL